jgi:hypothetical protein
LIAVELVRLRIVGQEDIRPSVSVEIENGNPKRLAARVGQPCLVRHVLEPAESQVAVKLRRRALVGFRRAVRFADAVERAPQISLYRPLHVVGYDKVSLAVLVVIEPGYAGSEVGVGDAGRFRHVTKLAVALVVKQAVALKSGNVQVLASVAVVVRRGDTQCIHLNVETAAGRNVGKSALAIVLIERRQGPASARRPVFAV